MPPVDCVVRLSRAVNSKDGPATTSRLKAELREELGRLFAAQIAAQARSVAAPPPSAP
jgi:ribonuclease P protein component